MAIFNCTVDGVKKECELKETVIPDLLVHFEQPSSYKGEFGFDWYRNYYATALFDATKLDSLKSEYTPTTIKGEEYFVPWLAMFPQQENVKLLLKVTMKGKVKGKAKDETIQLKAQSGIRFDPGEIKLSELQNKLEFEIQVFCDSPLADNAHIDVKLSYNDEVLGKLNVIKNAIIPDFNVKFVKVLGNEPNNTYNTAVFGNKQELATKFAGFFQELNTNFFNQALVRVTNDGIDELTINVQQYIDGGELVLHENTTQPRYNHDTISPKLYKDLVSQGHSPSYNGVVIFFMSMMQMDLRGGQGNEYPRLPDKIIMPPSAVNSFDACTLAHELGHTLGISHPFESYNYFDKLIQDIEKNKDDSIGAYDIAINKTTALCAGKPNPNVMYGGKKITLAQYTTQMEQKKNEIRQNCAKEVSYVNQIKRYQKYQFNQAETDNIMDYDGKTGDRMKTNPQTRIAFWKWQWESMSEEIKAVSNL